MTNNGTTNLPQRTHNMEQAKADLEQFGYCLVADALTPDQVAALRTRLEEQALAEIQHGLAYEDGGAQQNWGDFYDEAGRIRRDAFTSSAGGVNQRLWMLINKGKVFHKVLFVKPVRQLIDHLLGADYLLSSFTANIAKPGGVAMDLHTDQWWMPNPVRRGPAAVPIGSMTRQQSNWVEDEAPTLIAPTACANVMWMLNDFTEENGGTRLVPGTHLSGRLPDKVRDKDVESVAAAGSAGSALVFDGRLWHGTGANVSDGIRLGLLTTFCGPMLRPQENFTVGTAPEVVADAAPELLALLGFKIWNAYGRIESPVAEYIAQGETSLGELRPQAL